MTRRQTGLARATTATAALSFLDIVSAGFGGAVFLFVVFASFPTETPPPQNGGGKHFIDVQIKWPKREVAKLIIHENSIMESLNEEEWLNAVLETWTRLKLQHIILTEKWLENEAKVLEQLKKRGIRLETWDKTVEKLTSIPINRLDLQELCTKAMIDEIRILESLPEKPFSCKSKDKWTKIEKEIIQLENEMNSPLNEKVIGIDSARESVVNLHIEHIVPNMQGKTIKLNELEINLETDFVVIEEAPWELAQIIGFDNFGRYSNLENSELPETANMSLIRILEPAAGKWIFKASLYSVRDYFNTEREANAIEVAFTIHCSDGRSGSSYEKNINLSAGDFKPVPINIEYPCNFVTRS